MLASSCLLPQPPDYETKTTPPFLWSPTPTTTKILVAKGGGNCRFNVLVRSEDAPGDDLWAFLFLNYRIGGSEERQRGIVVVPAGTLSDLSRAIDMEWQVPVRTPGTMEQLSLVVSHRSNFIGDSPQQDDDVALLTWWVKITDSTEAGGNCFSSVGGAS